jgi:nitrogen fixation protein
LLKRLDVIQIPKAMVEGKSIALKNGWDWILRQTP